MENFSLFTARARAARKNDYARNRPKAQQRFTTSSFRATATVRTGSACSQSNAAKALPIKKPPVSRIGETGGVLHRHGTAAYAHMALQLYRYTITNDAM